MDERLSRVESVVVGVSTPAHAEETFNAIKRNLSANKGAGASLETAV